jgi:CPA2 family monovalent cation:H+ antiporter-2
MSARVSLETALLLAGAGEFAFVILGQAVDERLVDRTTGACLTVAATLSMATIPMLARLAAWIGRRRPRPETADVAPESPPEPRVLIAGYGRVGRLVGDMLRRHDIAWVGVEQDARLVDGGRKAGETLFFGDAARPDFLERCGLAHASALVVTMDDPDGAEAIVATARALRPDLTVVARARDARHAVKLYSLGATNAVPETIEASLQLSESVLVDLGVPMGYVIASVHEKRDEYRALLNRPDALGGKTRRARDAISRAWTCWSPRTSRKAA